MIYSLICTDTAESIHWQCELLEYSWSRYQQPGELVRLVACDHDSSLPGHRHAKTIRTAFTNVDPDSGDQYPPYNRLYSMKEWLDRENPSGTVLILDPDMVFRNSVKKEVEPDSPIGQQWVDFGMSERKKAVTAQISRVEFAQVQPVTWPALIHTDDLKKLMPRWIELTVEYRKATGGWEDDMFAFAVASAELGIVYSFENLCAWTPWAEEKVAGAPIVHYCQPLRDDNDEVIWSKNRYQPWSRVESPEAATLSYCRDLLLIVDEHARLQNTARAHRNETTFIALASYCEPELVSTIENCIDKALHPENLRFGICLQYDNDNCEETREDCLDHYLNDDRFRFVKYDYRESRGGCWARNLCQEFYQDEDYTLQVDAHSQFIEGWDAVLIQMLRDMPSEKPLITSFPPLYTLDENGQTTLSHLRGLNHIATTLAGSWRKEGWILHPQKFIPENNHFPRRTRFLSGAFVFTLGQWNDEVRQDPEHFYTGEEFALALRSYTHGYDLFDPDQIVVWHRLHPEPNRKYWNDNEESATNARHGKAISRLRKLLNGDPDNELGRYGLGNIRSLEDYRIFSGLDCSTLSIHPDATNGVPPDPVTIKNEIGADSDVGIGENGISTSQFQNTGLIQLTVHLDGLETLELDCNAQDTVLASLFRAMIRFASEGENGNEEVMYLQMGQEKSKTLYFFSSQILALETSPPMSAKFFENLADQDPQPAHSSGLVPAFNDSWKFWIWDNVNRGCSKPELFQTLLDNGFGGEDIRFELGFDPGQQVREREKPASTDYFIANGARLGNDNIELYVVKEFLNSAECEQLISMLKEDLVPSTTVSDTDDHLEWRTSRTGYFLVDGEMVPLAEQVQSRIYRIMGINPNYAEKIQGHFYLPGEEYKAHCDWFDKNDKAYDEYANPEQGGQRTWSVLLYLNDVEEGGGTRFPNIDETIYPEQGKLVVWNNLLPSGQPNPDVLHHAQPVIQGEKAVLTLWFRSQGDGDMFCREAGEETHNYTSKGFKRITMPRKLFGKLNAFYHQNAKETTEESILEFLSNDIVDQNVSDLVMLPRELKVEISHALKPVMEEWSNQTLESTAVYGLRRYFRGAMLKMHRDITSTHIISAILNIEQDVEIDWPLEIDDNYYRHHHVTMRPGDMLLYEGARVRHGRPTPLEGELFCNIFVHFMPSSGNPAMGDEITV